MSAESKETAVGAAIEKGVSSVKRGRTITEQARPRVLFIGEEFAELAGRLAEIVTTVGHVRHAGDANLKEWDCVVTVESPAKITQAPKRGNGWETPDITEWQWHQEFEEHLSIFLVLDPWAGEGVVECWPSNGIREAKPDHVLLTKSHVVGRHLTEVNELRAAVQDLVKQSLVPAAKARSDHFGLEHGHTDPPVRPFLFGPDDLILAGSYERGDGSAGVWVVPSDVPDLLPWVVAALREWSTLNPARFPAPPDWHDAEQWRSGEEVRLRADLAEFEGNLKAEVDRLLAERKQRLEAIEEAKVRADLFERALVTGQDTVLADAVARALQVLGFEVRDMDAEAEPGMFKEDYRITDPDAPDWLALGEAKGFTKGVSEAGLQSLARWTAFYVQETGGFPSARWYIANHMLRQDPSTRPVPLHGRDDVVEVFAADNGLVIDTRALFALVRFAQDNPDRRGDLRRWLRGRSGVLRVGDVEDWITGPGAVSR